MQENIKSEPVSRHSCTLSNRMESCSHMTQDTVLVSPNVPSGPRPPQHLLPPPYHSLHLTSIPVTCPSPAVNRQMPQTPVVLKPRPKLTSPYKSIQPGFTPVTSTLPANLGVSYYSTPAVVSCSLPSQHNTFFPSSSTCPPAADHNHSSLATGSYVPVLMKCMAAEKPVENTPSHVNTSSPFSSESVSPHIHTLALNQAYAAYVKAIERNNMRSQEHSTAHSIPEAARVELPSSKKKNKNCTLPSSSSNLMPLPQKSLRTIFNSVQKVIEQTPLSVTPKMPVRPHSVAVPVHITTLQPSTDTESNSVGSAKVLTPCKTVSGVALYHYTPGDSVRNGSQTIAGISHQNRPQQLSGIKHNPVLPSESIPLLQEDRRSVENYETQLPTSPVEVVTSSINLSQAQTTDSVADSPPVAFTPKTFYPKHRPIILAKRKLSANSSKGKSIKEILLRGPENTTWRVAKICSSERFCEMYKKPATTQENAQSTRMQETNEKMYNAQSQKTGVRNEPRKHNMPMSPDSTSYLNSQSVVQEKEEPVTVIGHSPQEENVVSETVDEHESIVIKAEEDLMEFCQCQHNSISELESNTPKKKKVPTATLR